MSIDVRGWQVVGLQQRCDGQRIIDSGKRVDGIGHLRKRASAGSKACRQRAAAIAPSSCPLRNIGTLRGEMPANVSVSARARVTAGLANDVDEVNQYALVMNAATATGMASRRKRDRSMMINSNPKVAIASPKPSPSVGLTWAEVWRSGSPYIA